MQRLMLYVDTVEPRWFGVFSYALPFPLLIAVCMFLRVTSLAQKE